MNYYEENSQAFIDNTLNIDMSEFYSIFLERLSHGSTILDIGCGAGRDLKYFKGQGHRVVGLEPSQKLAAYAHSYAGCEIHHKTIEQFEKDEEFDGIWACASLLHIDTPNLKISFDKVKSLMYQDSVFYCSFKYGDFEGQRNGRFFNDQTLESLEYLLPKEMRVSRHWITDDAREDRNERWLNLIITLQASVSSSYQES